MTLKEAEHVEYILRSLKMFKDMDKRVIRLHKEKKYEEVTRIACEMSSELVRLYEEKLNQFPSPL